MTMTAQQLQARLAADSADKGVPGVGDRPDFKADRLTVTITSQRTGDVVLEGVMEPKGFSAKARGKGGEITSSIGWQLQARGDDCGTYRAQNAAFPVQVNLMAYLDGIKVAPNEGIDLRNAEAPGDGAANDDAES